MAERLEACRAILNTKFRWIGLSIEIVWVILMFIMIRLIGIGTYFAIFVALLLINTFFTIDTCMSARKILFSLVPLIVPLFGFIAIILLTAPDTLQLLTGLDPGEVETVSADLEETVADGWLLAFTEIGRGAPNIAWMSFLPLYIIGFIVYTWADASDRDGLKGIATIVLVAPIAIQIWLGFQFGVSYGLLGSYIGDTIGYLGEIGAPIVVLIGSALDFILVSILLGIEHAIVEEEEL